jgi:ribosome-associated protein
MEKVKIETPFIKLDQFIKWCGVSSSGVEAKYIVKEGNVKVNGNVETQRGKKLKGGDIVEINGVSYQID